MGRWVVHATSTTGSDVVVLVSEHLFDTLRPRCGGSRARPDHASSSRSASHEVTFVVVDLETTGGSPAEGAITEIGAVKVRAGEVLGEFQTLVDPGHRSRPYVAHLTGIDDRLVAGLAVDRAGPALLPGVRARRRLRRPQRLVRPRVPRREPRCATTARRCPAPVVCTAKLARRVVWPDVPNVRLATLARYFRTRVQPIAPGAHRRARDRRGPRRALELGARLGIHTLGELFHACSARGPSELRQDQARRGPHAGSRRLPVPSGATGACCTSASPPSSASG